MADQFNILDRRSVTYIDSKSEPITITSVSTETEIHRFTIPGQFIQNGIIISLQAHFKKSNLGGPDIITNTIYAGSIGSGNEIFTDFRTGTFDVGMDKLLYIQGGDILTTLRIEYVNTGLTSFPVSITPTLNQDLDIIFTGDMANPGTNFVTLVGYICNVIY